MKINLTAFTAVAVLTSTAPGGPIAWGLCQTACNAGYGVCCVSAGAVAGTFTIGIGTPLALIACSAAQGACMVACASLAMAPTPKDITTAVFRQAFIALVRASDGE